MNPFELRRLGKTDVHLPALGFGGAGLGQNFAVISEEQALATVEAGWQAGVRFYDTSPWYGRGLSERRIGSALWRKPRKEVILSTKVGRIFTAPHDPDAYAQSERAWEEGLHFPHHYDYTYDGVMRSYEDSLQRLGMNRIDLLVIHDLDFWHHAVEAKVQAYLGQLVGGGWRALANCGKMVSTQRIGW